MLFGRYITLTNAFLERMYPIVRRRQFRGVIGSFAKRSPEIMVPIEADIERKHVELWKRLDSNPSVAWVRQYSNVSGIHDYRYCPEDVYHSQIERILNDRSRRGVECADKNTFYIFVDRKYTVPVVVRYMRDMFMDEDFNVLSEKEVGRILMCNYGDLIMKSSLDSLGGHGVRALKFSSQVNGYVDKKNGIRVVTPGDIRKFGPCIVQKRIEQCAFSEQFNPSSCNTFRMITLRCLWDGKVMLLKAGFRLGVSDSPVDNLSSGGICVPVDSKGNLSDHAFSFMALQKYVRYDEHPTSHIKFAGKCHPNFDEMKQAVIASARRIPNDNILAWDVVYTKTGEVKFLEVNKQALSIDWMQYNGPLFGDLTEKVIDWCVNHRHLGKDRVVKFY